MTEKKETLTPPRKPDGIITSEPEKPPKKKSIKQFMAIEKTGGRPHAGGNGMACGIPQEEITKEALWKCT